MSQAGDSSSDAGPDRVVASERPTGARRRALRLGRLLALALALVTLRLAPAWWCGREADRWFRGDAELARELLRGTSRLVGDDLDPTSFRTGSPKFDGEWLFGSYLMAGLGAAQVAREHPALRREAMALLRRCLDRLRSPTVQAFDGREWGEAPLDSLDGPRGHAAYLGYLNLLLGLDRLLDPATPHRDLHDRVTRALVRRLEASPLLLLETYPGEVYPVDNAAVVASLALHDRATGGSQRALLDRWAMRLRAQYRDPRTGLLFQRVDRVTGAPQDGPRGSGTALASVFLAYSHPRLSRELHRALQRSLSRSILGFGVLREHPPGRAGARDIDSGPIVLGFGLSATGFAIGPSRIHGDRAAFRRLVATATLFGAPHDGEAGRRYLAGGPLGTAILFAMLTAPRMDGGAR